jgi:hypothetical protein
MNKASRGKARREPRKGEASQWLGKARSGPNKFKQGEGQGKARQCEGRCKAK